MAYKRLKEDIQEARKDFNTMTRRFKKWAADPEMKEQISSLEKRSTVQHSELLAFIHQLYQTQNFVFDYLLREQRRQAKMYDSLHILHDRIDRLAEEIKRIAERKRTIGFK